MHWAGRAARRVLDDARDALAAFVGTESGSIVFTSGGTEANNLAIHGRLAQHTGGRVVVSAIEHPSVLQPLAQWAKRGFEIIHVRPTSGGMVDATEFSAHLSADTRLACLMAANNETGVLQPVREVARACRKRGIPLLVDAVQALGKMPVNAGDWDVDLISLSAHKIGGPKGVGALLVRRGLHLTELTAGGGQERGRRSGTENVPGVAGFAAALGEIDYGVLRSVRDHFESLLCRAMPDARIYGQEEKRLPNTSMFCLPGMDGETLLMQLDLAGFAVASGSACSSGKQEASHVLLAMGCSRDVARSSIRVSFGPGNSDADAEALVVELQRIRKRLQAMAGMSQRQGTHVH